MKRFIGTDRTEKALNGLESLAEFSRNLPFPLGSWVPDSGESSQT